MNVVVGVISSSYSANFVILQGDAGGSMDKI